MPQAEALATLPALASIEEDLDADRTVLEQLATWSERYSPIIGVEDTLAPSSLYLDTTGCATCFGGEEALLRRVCQEFGEQGWNVHVALADTLGATWAVTHYRTQCERIEGLLQERYRGERQREGQGWFALVPTGESEHILAGLPIAALHLRDGIVVLLSRLGVARIGQLAALPRSQVAERLGADVFARLDQAYGRAAEVIEPYHARPEATASCSFEYPLERSEAVAAALDVLLLRLQTTLEKQQRGTRLLECALYQEGAGPLRFECGLSRPLRAADYLGKLLRSCLEQVRLTAPIGGICLRATVIERIPEGQGELFDQEGKADQAAFSQLLDNLAARLGKEAVVAARFVSDPQPELACHFESALESERGTSAPPARDRYVFRHRPLRLFPRPVPVEVVALVPEERPLRFRHAGADHVVLHCQGPERIETGWWRGEDIQRDYFRVETTEGTYWWIFRRLDNGRWFLHGCFD
jgi:protein ImuB